MRHSWLLMTFELITRDENIKFKIINCSKSTFVSSGNICEFFYCFCKESHCFHNTKLYSLNSSKTADSC